MAVINSEAVSIKYYERVIALFILHANHIFSAPYYIVIYSPSGFTMFFHIS